jgi:RimJ/RimL family protein N-acetyltransferase
VTPRTDPKFEDALVSFRPLATEDLPQLHRWINHDAEVRRWFARDAGPFEQLVAKYAPRIAGRVPTRCYIIEYAARPIGYIQDYLISDHPGWARLVEVDEPAAGVDLLIGDPARRGDGKGTVVLRKFLREVVFARSAAAVCIITPQPANARAIRCYQKVGFRYVRTFYDPDGNEWNYLMRISRDQACRASRD